MAGTLTGSTAPDTITANGGLSATGTVNLNGGDLSTTSLTVSGTLVATGTETITVTGNVDFSNAGNNFTPGHQHGGHAGAGTTLNAPQETFYNLSPSKAAPAPSRWPRCSRWPTTCPSARARPWPPRNYNISVSRNWSNAGSFTAGTGTVTFAGTTTATISGDTTFNNFVCTAAGKTLQFTAGSTQTISGSLTITGAAGAANLISLVSTSLGSPWTLDCAAPQTVTYALVRDGNVLTSDITANTSRNDGGNDDTAQPPLDLHSLHPDLDRRGEHRLERGGQLEQRLPAEHQRQRHHRQRRKPARHPDRRHDDRQPDDQRRAPRRAWPDSASP